MRNSLLFACCILFSAFSIRTFIVLPSYTLLWISSFIPDGYRTVVLNWKREMWIESVLKNPLFQDRFGRLFFFFSFLNSIFTSLSEQLNENRRDVSRLLFPIAARAFTLRELEKIELRPWCFLSRVPLQQKLFFLLYLILVWPMFLVTFIYFCRCDHFLLVLSFWNHEALKKYARFYIKSHTARAFPFSLFFSTSKNYLDALRYYFLN